MAKAKSVKRKKFRANSTPVLATLGELQSLQVFRETPNPILEGLGQEVRRITVDSGETILEFEPGNEAFSHFFFIARGQVKMEGFDEDAHARPLNFLRKGEFFVDKAVIWKGKVATRITAITAAKLLIISRKSLRAISLKHPALAKQIAKLAERIDLRHRIYAEDPYASSIMEFLVDQELTQASRVKITQMDKCIACNTCYDACEDRHGFQRLGRGYARFGTLDIAQSCLTCFYPTCIPSCPVDSVVFNSETGEVEILDECIGCTACERACQYGAIRMHRVLDGDSRFDRFLAPDKSIKPKLIADKCNHCFGFDDLACVTHCPTGAIIEAEGSDILENPKIFGISETDRNALPDLMRRTGFENFLQESYIVIGLLTTLFLFWETFSLRRFPNLSILQNFQKAGWISSDFALEIARGSPLSIFLGNIGFLLIFLALIYPLRKAFPFLFKYLGKKPLWLDFHNFCGAMGVVFIFFHSGFHFPLSFSTLGFLALLMVASSGILGRFLYQAIPRSVAGTELVLRDIEAEDRSVTEKLFALVEDPRSQEWIKGILNSAIAPVGEKIGLKALVWSFLRSRILLLKLRFRMPKEIKLQKRQLAIFLDLIRAKIELKRNLTFLHFTSDLFEKWQFIHRPFAYVMGTVAIGHIVYNLVYFSFQ